MPTLLYIPWWKPEPIRLIEDLPFLHRPLEIHPFGMLVAMGVLVGAIISNRRARSQGLHPSAMNEFAGHVLIGGFVLGHMLDAVFYHWDVVRVDPLLVVRLWDGLSSFGGFAGAVIGGLIWMARRRYPLLVFGDITSFAFPFAWLFGRMGCFVAHDHPGRVTDFFLGVEDYHVMGGYPPWQVRHDLGLYEIAWCVAMIPLVLWLGRTKRPWGFYLAFIPMMYAPARFGLDFLRATDVPQHDPRSFGLTPGHYAAIGLFLAGLAVAIRVRRGPAVTVPDEVRWIPEDAIPEEARAVEEALSDGADGEGDEEE